MDRLSRREALATADNPDSRRDYVVAMSGTLSGLELPCHVTIRYVPDRLIVIPESFMTYLAALSRHNWDHLEEAALVILDDLCNELVARWIQVDLSQIVSNAMETSSHRILVEDRQPNWDNAALLARVGAAETP